MRTLGNASTPSQRAAPHRWTEAELVRELALDAIKINPLGRDGKTKHDASSASTTTAANDNKILESNRNNRLTSLAGSMRRKGCSFEAIHAALQTENLMRCDPSLDAEEVKCIALSIMRYDAQNSDDVIKTLTDAGNAERFGKRYADSLRYVVGLGWHIWNGHFWELDQVGSVMELAKEAASNIYKEGEGADDATRSAIAKHAKASASSARLKAMVELAQSLPNLVITADRLDANDNHLCVANGVIDLRTGKLQAARREDLMTRQSPVMFDPTATCSQFEQFIDQTTGGNRELARYLQRVVGYTLTGLTREQCFFFLYGSGANGKSTFLNVLKELLGSGLSRQTPSETLMTRHTSATNDIARLQFVRMVIANEIEDGSLLAESLVKQMTGGEALTARFHYQEFFEFHPKFKLMIAGNHKPVIRGRDNGIWRRIRLIPFEVTFTADQQDKNLQNKLRVELPGILNWALRGCGEWMGRGLAAPKVITDAVSSYREEMDLISSWAKEDCTVGPQFECKAGTAYSSYKFWSEQSGYKPMSIGTFSREFGNRFKKVGRKDGNYFVGLKLGRA